MSTEPPSVPTCAVRASLGRARESALARLTERRRDLDAVLTDVGSHSPADDEHDPDGSPTSLQRMLAAALVAQAAADVESLDHAVRQLAEGGYGRCERCRREISPERLTALPAAQHCVACAELIGRGRLPRR